MIPIQTTIVGYTGKACTLFSAYDPETHVLAITVDYGYLAKRRDACMVITNDPKIDRDMLFTEDDLQQAITDFFFMQGGVASDGKSPRLTFGDRSPRANPAQSIEKDGINANGQRYRIADGISNSQVATLATCWYANTHVSTVDDVLDMADRLINAEREIRYSAADFNMGEIFTL